MKNILFAAIVACSALLSPKTVHAGEKEERAAISTAAKDAFLAGRYEDLDATAETFRNSRPVTSSGQRKLAFFYDVLTSATWLYGDQDPSRNDKSEAQIAAWLKTNPRSVTANVLLANASLLRAWIARGDGFANTVSEQQWKDMRAFAQQGLRALEQSRRSASRDPQWYVTYLELSKLTERSTQFFNTIADEALALDPNYFPVRDTILHRLTPQWGGSVAAIDDAIEKFVALTSRELGQTLYARSYQWLASTRFRRNIFINSLAKWPRMKQGFEDLTARYPSDENFNTFGVYACFAQDWDTLKAILDRLGDRVIDEHWFGEAGRERCVRGLERARAAAEDAEHYSKPQPVAEELAERFRIEDEATEALLAGRFDEIETKRTTYLSTKARTASGAWKLAFYTEGLTSFRKLLPGNGAVSDQIRARIEEWKAAYPDSIAAKIATARLALVDAKMLKWQTPTIEPGMGVSTVAQRVNVARTELEAARSAGERDPVWWATRLLVDLWDIVPDGDFEALAKNALAAAPDYSELRALILARPDTGSRTFLGDYDRSIALVLSAVQPDERDEAYADSYLQFGDRWGGDGIVGEMKVDWPRMRRGLDMLTQRWPSDWNLNAYARFACMAQDRQTAAALLARIGDGIVEGRWGSWRRPIQCREWARAE